MWTDFAKACQAGLTASCLFLLALSLAVCVGLTLAPLIREQWAKLRKLRPLEKAVGLVAVVVATSAIVASGVVTALAGAVTIAALVLTAVGVLTRVGVLATVLGVFHLAAVA